MCGLIAVSGSASSPFEVFFGLMNLQHRGQDGAGIRAALVDSNCKRAAGSLKTFFLRGLSRIFAALLHSVIRDMRRSVVTIQIFCNPF
jgi:glutamine phosphoribosylpyrophosphate amidotransferase